ncbi:hypothetical protein NUU61_001846 [Penicillium alfredii]|uniref:Wax synthase domain-containing protein n=1 Tax=Penicillium alfredii TaxID=1506179 RepID=A0A9W9FQE3_9EURO|nr:uncharacterized protein NUU61_001846 [Penicillium alfredii]KAJ5104499.1 hypothetical protein NUU61_001846 [Penicillium alfredii]
MADLRSGSYRDLVQKHETELEILLAQGIFKPVFMYHVLIFNTLPLVGLVVPRSRSTRYVRPVILALSLGIAIEVLQNRRTLLGGNGYMIGLMTAWWLVWSATLFIFSDLEQDFRRIERETASKAGPRNGSKCALLTNVEDTSDSKDEQENCFSRGKYALVDQQVVEEDNPRIAAGKIATATDAEHESFHWQSYPKKLSHRLDWCAGLLFNLRGPEWNWRAPHLGPLPRPVHAQLHPGFVSNKMHTHDDTSFMTAKRRLQCAFTTCFKSYLLLDILKVVMMRDPYFQGVATPESALPFPFAWLAYHHLLVRFYHCFLSCVGVFVALNFVTSFSPIIFLGLSLAFPNASRKLTATSLDVPWLYADTFGPFLSPILDHGLAGCWGRWWHQLFRYGFTATARWVLSCLPATWAARPPVKRTIYVVTAFSLSGFVHACGSHTQFTNTHPLSGSFLFFSMQIAAIMAEGFFKTSVFPNIPLASTPRGLRRTANIVFVFFWLFFSGAFIADDFARGGLWLMEPIPISPLRGLGIGLQGEGWWCWKGPWFRYWSDGTYWGSGVRVI